jgi:hypothetical protein
MHWMLTYSVYFMKYQNYALPTPTSCLALSCGCDGQKAFCCRTNILLLLHKLFVLPFSPYLSSRSRTNSQFLLRTTNCPLASDFWIVRSERTFSVFLQRRVFRHLGHPGLGLRREQKSLIGWICIESFFCWRRRRYLFSLHAIIDVENVTSCCTWTVKNAIVVSRSITIKDLRILLQTACLVSFFATRGQSLRGCRNETGFILLVCEDVVPS